MKRRQFLGAIGTLGVTTALIPCSTSRAASPPFRAVGQLRIVIPELNIAGFYRVTGPIKFSDSETVALAPVEIESDTSQAIQSFIERKAGELVGAFTVAKKETPIGFLQVFQEAKRQKSGKWTAKIGIAVSSKEVIDEDWLKEQSVWPDNTRVVPPKKVEELDVGDEFPELTWIPHFDEEGKVLHRIISPINNPLLYFALAY